MANVKLENIEKQYEGNPKKSVIDFNIDIEHGEFIVLVGPSGCGKSTTLRMIAGLEEITSGRLYIDNKDCTNLAAKDRDIAMVFQNYALYGHMTVYQNMAFSLTLRKEKIDVIHEKVMAAAEILGLKTELNKKPSQLSGGQRQRVAVGRAIVRSPKVFLFDEPLSNLDAKLRSGLRRELKLLHHKLGATMIYVTHDQIEALTLADRIVVMSNAVVKQIGTSLEVYGNPDNLFTASFMGTPPMNFILALYHDGKLYNKSAVIELDEKNNEILKRNGYEGKKVVFGVRPEHFRKGDRLIMDVTHVEKLGAYSLIHGNVAGVKVIAKFPEWTDIERKQQIGLDYDENLVCFFDAETEDRIR